MSTNPNKKQATTELGIGSGDSVMHSNAAGLEDGRNATPQNLELEIALLRAENEKLRQAQSSPNDSVNKLAEALLAGLNKAQAPAQPVNQVDVNRAADFKNTRATVDGRSLAEQQAALQMFRNEAKKPISIPKSFQNSIGPNLAITVNGIRVSIPCDGKTYFINETHWEHARERMAKVDILNTTPDDVQEIQG